MAIYESCVWPSGTRLTRFRLCLLGRRGQSSDVFNASEKKKHKKRREGPKQKMRREGPKRYEKARNGDVWFYVSVVSGYVFGGFTKVHASWKVRKSKRQPKNRRNQSGNVSGSWKFMRSSLFLPVMSSGPPSALAFAFSGSVWLRFWWVHESSRFMESAQIKTAAKK